MELFDGFNKKQGPTLTPTFIFVASMTYMVAADGHIDDREVIPIINMLGTGYQLQAIGLQAMKYATRNSLEKFLKKSNKVLDAEQKLCIVANLLDVLFSDGHADQAEREMFMKFCTVWGVPKSDYEPLIRASIVKNDRSVILGK